MLENLISLEDSHIELVLTAVTQWCVGQGISVDSIEGRRAVTAAVDLVTSHGDRNLLGAISARLGAPSYMRLDEQFPKKSSFAHRAKKF